MQVEIALDFARGLAYLHSRRLPIVHRDLKPANLMISGNLHAAADQLYLDSGVIKVRRRPVRLLRPKKCAYEVTGGQLYLDSGVIKVRITSVTVLNLWFSLSNCAYQQ